MRLLIVGTLNGQLTTATKIAMDKGAMVTHAADIAQALAVLRSGPRRRSADGRRRDRHPRPRQLARGRAYPRADRRLRHRHRCPRRGRRDPCRRQGIHPAAARRRIDRRRARRRRRRPARTDLPRRRHGARRQARPADRHQRCFGADHRRIPAPARKCWRATCTPARAGPRSRSSASIAPPSRNRCSNPSCSATKRAPSPARWRAASASSRKPTAARCCSTRFPRWTCGCRPSCCAPSRSASSTASAAPGRCRSISASSPPRTATWPKRCAMARSARICCSGSMSST